jgi:hypothetical protein
MVEQLALQRELGDIRALQTDAALGYWVQDVGTNAEPGGRDVLAYLSDISLSVCNQINKGLGLGSTPAQIGGGINWGLNGGLGESLIGNGDGNNLDAYPGQAFACANHNPTPGFFFYDYYHVLVEQ